MIDQSHLDCYIVHQTSPYEFHAHGPSLDFDVFPPEIETLLGNELNFEFKSIRSNEDDLIVEYHQIDSPFRLFLYFDLED